MNIYRPGRWTDAGVEEEHRFVAELVEHELPIVAPIAVNGHTLHYGGGHRYAVYPRQGGRWPEFGSAADREMLGRFVGRIHAVGALGRFGNRQEISIERMGRDASQYLLLGDWLPAHLVVA